VAASRVATRLDPASVITSVDSSPERAMPYGVAIAVAWVGFAGSRFWTVTAPQVGLQVRAATSLSNMRLSRSIRFSPSSPFTALRASVWVRNTRPPEDTARPYSSVPTPLATLSSEPVAAS
jgi:hypothetical protein